MLKHNLEQYLTTQRLRDQILKTVKIIYKSKHLKIKTV